MAGEFYNYLGLPFDASADEIRQAYFDAARRFHPDANPEQDAREEFLRIQQAYETLSSPEKRKIYDRSIPDNLKVPLTAAMSIRVSRSVIPAMQEPQLLYTLIDINCTGEMDSSRMPPSAICLVIDRSTSMKGERLEMVKANVAQLIKTLKPKDLISIVVFSDRADVIIPPTQVSD